MDQYSIKTLLCVVGNEFGSIQITMYNNIIVARTITYQNKYNVQYKTSNTFVLYMYWPQIIPQVIIFREVNKWTSPAT